MRVILRRVNFWSWSGGIELEDDVEGVCDGRGGGGGGGGEGGRLRYAVVTS